MELVTRAVLVIAVVLAALIALSFIGRLHPIGDSFAVFRWYMLVCLALSLTAAIGLKRRRAILSAAVLCWAILAVNHFLAALADPIGAPLDGDLIYQKNLNFRLPDVRPIAVDIVATNPGFVTLQEVTERNKELMEQLSEKFPSQHWCPFNAVGGTAVLSRFPIIEGSQRCAEGGFSAMQVNRRGKPTWIVSLHLHWPWPYDQRAQLEALSNDLAALDGTILVGGDFNMVPWSHTMRRLAQLTGTRIAPGSGPTFNLRNLINIQIDHVLVDYCGHATQRPLFGSDHKGVLARFGNDC